MNEVRTTEEEILFDEKTAALLVKDAAELVIQKLMVDRNIRLDDWQMTVLAGKAAEFIDVDIDYPAIAENVISNITDLTETVRGDLLEKITKEMVQPIDGRHGSDGKDGEHGKDGSDGKEGLPGADGKDYMLTVKDRQDISATIIKQNKKYKLTDKIRADIAEKTFSDFMRDDKAIEAIVDAVLASDRVVSRDGFVKKLKEIRNLVDLSKKQNKSHINAGISGEDMIGDITKILGTAWKTGGGGGIADLKITIVNKNANAQLAADELQKIIEYTNGGSDFTFTIPLEATVSIPVGSWIQIRKTGVGNISVVKETAGVTFRANAIVGNNDFKLEGEDGFSVFMEKTSVNTWLVSGNIQAF